MTVVVIGDLNVDLEIALPQEAAAGVSYSHPPAQLTGGGSAANTAVALARLGVPTRFCGAVGSDGFGREAVQGLTDEGVATDVVVVDDLPTVVVVVVIPPDKDRLIYVWPPTGGAHLELRQERAVAAVEGASWVHVSGISFRGEPAAGAILEAMGAAREQGIPVSFDLNLRLENWGWETRFRAVVEEAIAHSDVVFGSGADEICPLAGIDDPEAAARQLTAHHRTVVARLGADGVVACSGSRTLHYPAFAVDVVDTVGAGDAFNAGYIAAAIEGGDTSAALRWGSGAAALCVTGRGARSSPDRSALAAYLAV